MEDSVEEVATAENETDNTGDASDCHLAFGDFVEAFEAVAVELPHDTDNPRKFLVVLIGGDELVLRLYLYDMRPFSRIHGKNQLKRQLIDPSGTSQR